MKIVTYQNELGIIKESAEDYIAELREVKEIRAQEAVVRAKSKVRSWEKCKNGEVFQTGYAIITECVPQYIEELPEVKKIREREAEELAELKNHFWKNGNNGGYYQAGDIIQDTTNCEVRPLIPRSCGRLLIIEGFDPGDDPSKDAVYVGRYFVLGEAAVNYNSWLSEPGFRIPERLAKLVFRPPPRLIDEIYRSLGADEDGSPERAG